MKFILLFLLSFNAYCADWYVPSGNPTPNSQMASSILRGEYSSIGTAFAKMPPLSGYNGLMIGVNPSGTALSAYTASQALTAIGAQASSANLTSVSNGLSSLGLSLITDTTTGAMQTTLGISSLAQNALSQTTTSGLQSAIGITAGTASGNFVTMTSAPALPAVDGSTLNNLQGSTPNITVTAASGILTATLNAPAKINVSYNGITNQTSLTSNATLAIPALASLGDTTAIQTRLVFAYSYVNGSLAVINTAGGTILDETNEYTPAVIGTGSTSASTMYTASGSTLSPYKIVGFVDATWISGSGWTITGTVSSAPASSQSMAAMSSLGYGQTWQIFTVGTTRIVGTTYYNATGKPISVQLGSNNGTCYMAINGVSNVLVAAYSLLSIVPAGASYSVSSNANINYWSELR